jgi:membrane-associated protease RseP (regulator of RpoE activity)
MEPTTSPSTATNKETKNTGLWWVAGIAALALGVMALIGACMLGALGGYAVSQSRYSRQINVLQQQLQQPERVPAPQMLPEGIPLPAPELPFEFELPDLTLPASGALVSEVIAGSPAERAGLQPGALIVAIDGVPVTAEEGLGELISRYQPGDEVSISFLQLGQGSLRQQEVMVTLDANPDDASRAFLGVFYGQVQNFQQPQP